MILVGWHWAASLVIFLTIPLVTLQARVKLLQNLGQSEKDEVLECVPQLQWSNERPDLSIVLKKVEFSRQKLAKSLASRDNIFCKGNHYGEIQLRSILGNQQ